MVKGGREPSSMHTRLVQNIFRGIYRSVICLCVRAASSLAAAEFAARSSSRIPPGHEADAREARGAAVEAAVSVLLRCKKGHLIQQGRRKPWRFEDGDVSPSQSKRLARDSGACPEPTTRQARQTSRCSRKILPLSEKHLFSDSNATSKNVPRKRKLPKRLIHFRKTFSSRACATASKSVSSDSFLTRDTAVSPSATAFRFTAGRSRCTCRPRGGCRVTRNSPSWPPASACLPPSSYPFAWPDSTDRALARHSPSPGECCRSDRLC